jgi:hypothetical protein
MGSRPQCKRNHEMTDTVMATVTMTALGTEISTVTTVIIHTTSGLCRIDRFTPTRSTVLDFACRQSRCTNFSWYTML